MQYYADAALLVAVKPDFDGSACALFDAVKPDYGGSAKHNMKVAFTSVLVAWGRPSSGGRSARLWSRNVIL